MDDIIVLRVKKVISETSEAITLVLQADVQVSYSAGQFLTFIFDVHGKEVRRSYSLSSAPGIDPDMAVTVKRVQNGEISRYLFEKIKEGDVLRSLRPSGRFTAEGDHKGRREVFLFGAGSGIVPLFSILKTILRNESESRVNLIYSNHDQHSIIFLDEINRLREDYPDRFNCIHILSAAVTFRGNVISGHLNNITLGEIIAKYSIYGKEKSVFYICGPFAYMRMLVLTLPMLGFGRHQIHKEAFLTEINESQAQVPAGNITAKVKIIKGGREYTISVPAGKTILRAAKDNNIGLPYSCETGICSTCSAYCVQGKIAMSINEVLTDKDQSKGLILTCTGYPVTTTAVIRFE